MGEQEGARRKGLGRALCVLICCSRAQTAHTACLLDLTSAATTLYSTCSGVILATQPSSVACAPLEAGLGVS